MKYQCNIYLTPDYDKISGFSMASTIDDNSNPIWSVYQEYTTNEKGPKRLLLMDSLDKENAEHFLHMCTETLKLRQPKYFLFGSQPVDDFFEEGIESISREDDGDIIDGCTYEYNGVSLEQLMCDYSGWGNFALLTKEEYDQLNSEEV